MKKYISCFRLRFTMGLQYRVAAWAGIVTQFVWGAMEILMFRAFYEWEPEKFPMSFQATVNYVWFQQAFLALFAAWMLENEIFQSIKTGDIAYELCRPVRLYPMFFARGAALRISRAVLRCMPILAVAFVLPVPWGLRSPADTKTMGLFMVSMVLGLLVTVAFGTLMYVAAFFTVSPDGLRALLTSVMEFFSGAVIPLPFFPDRMKAVMELLPFGAMQNVPLRIYSGDLAGGEALRAMALQVFWLTAMVLAGELFMVKAKRRLTVQGG